MTLEDVEKLHPRFAGATAFYHKELEPFLVEQEALRSAAYKQLVRYSLILLPLAATTIAAIWFAGGFDAGWVGWVMAGLTVVATLGTLGWLTSKVSAVTSRVKQEMLARISTFLDFTYNAEPTQARLDWFRDTRIVPSYDRSSLEDELLGECDGISFALSEAHLEDRRTRRDSNGRTETYYVTVFRGLLARFTFAKPFAGRTILVRDGGMLGNLFSRFGKQGERVRLEDPRFEESFEVFSSDQVEARYLLTPRFMERVMELEALLDGKLQLAFDADHLLISVNGGKDRFEGGGLSARIDDPDAVARLFEEIGIVFDIITALNLATATRA